MPQEERVSRDKGSSKAREETDWRVEELDLRIERLSQREVPKSVGKPEPPMLSLTRPTWMPPEILKIIGYTESELQRGVGLLHISRGRP